MEGTFDILAGHPLLYLVADAAVPGSAEYLPLLRAEKAEFEAVLGVGVEVVTSPEAVPDGAPRWLVRLHPDGPAELSFDPMTLTLTSRVADAAGYLATLNLLHTLARTGASTVQDLDCPDLISATDRVADEVLGSFPGFDLRGIDRNDWLAGRPGGEVTEDDLMHWVAGLDDAHTTVARSGPVYQPPYLLRVDRSGVGTFVRVPEFSAAFAAGVRPGWQLADDLTGSWRRTGASPRMKPWVAGRRALAMPGGVPRQFHARTSGGDQAEWTEVRHPPAAADMLRWRKVNPGTGFLTIGQWRAGLGMRELIDRALTELEGCRTLILDLQSNPGGDLMLATSVRDRFLRERTLIGSIAFSTGTGSLASPVPRWAEPSADVRWPGKLIVLTDPMTYSASEDFLLGLQGLPHVTVVGARSGGGSGRPRTVRLTPGLELRVSTALTYDRSGECIEYTGVPVDEETTVLGPGNAAYKRALWLASRA